MQSSFFLGKASPAFWLLYQTHQFFDSSSGLLQFNSIFLQLLIFCSWENTFFNWPTRWGSNDAPSPSTQRAISALSILHRSQTFISFRVRTQLTRTRRGRLPEPRSARPLPPPAAAQPHPAAPSSARASAARPSDRAALMPRREKMPPARLRRDGAAAPIRGGGRSYPRCRCPAGALLPAGPAPRPVEPSPSERPSPPRRLPTGTRRHAGGRQGTWRCERSGGRWVAAGRRGAAGEGDWASGSGAKSCRAAPLAERLAVTAGQRLQKICDVRNFAFTGVSFVFLSF